MPKPKSRQEQKEMTRKRILETAMALFREKGFLSVTTSEVANTADCSHGTVFAHYPTRDSLIEAVIGEFSGPMLERIHRVSEAGTGLLSLLTTHLKALSEEEDLYYHLISEERQLPPSAGDALTTINSAVSLHFERALLADGLVGTGELGLPFIFNLWLGMVNHYVLNRNLFSPGESILGKRGKGMAEDFNKLIRGNSNPERWNGCEH